MELLIRRELEPGILELRLNRPDRLNALTASLTGELMEAFEALREDRATRVVILTGAGNGFCAGADLQEPASPGDVPGTEGSSSLGFVYRFQEYLARLVLVVHECYKPVIAAVNGAAELMLTGRVFDAAEARELRIVSHVVEPGALEAAALAVARSIAEHSEYGTRMTKKGLWLAIDAPSLRHAMEIENRTQVLGTCTGSFLEALEAFREKRKPQWQPW